MKKLLRYRKSEIINIILLVLISAICLLPLVNVLAISFSSSAAVGSGQVRLLPVDFTLASYKYVLHKPEFFRAFIISIKRVLLGVPVNMLLTILVAYPLSKETHRFRARSFYSWYFVLTLLFSGGLIAWYMTILKTGLIDSLAALILPGAVPVFNVLILMNYFRGIPKEIEEAAIVDGASQWRILIQIYAPLAIPCLATLTLFSIVGHWNQWFDGIMLMNSPERYPLQSYLQTVIVNRDITMMTNREALLLMEINDRTNRAAQVVIAALPVLMLFPFIQRFFIKGIVLGSVKG